MKTNSLTQEQLEIYPVTKEHWQELQELFGLRGACAGCWCMYWRLKRSEFQQQSGEGNRLALKALIESGEIPGLLAFLPASSETDSAQQVGAQPVGWVSIAPRQTFPLLERSRILKPVDERPVWSVVCFYVARRYRCQGLTAHLLRSAVDYAVQHGATIVEGYPVEPKKDRTADAFVYTGLASTFRECGFVEIARRSETRPIMRYFAK